MSDVILVNSAGAVLVVLSGALVVFSIVSALVVLTGPLAVRLSFFVQPLRFLRFSRKKTGFLRGFEKRIQKFFLFFKTRFFSLHTLTAADAAVAGRIAFYLNGVFTLIAFALFVTTLLESDLTSVVATNHTSSDMTPFNRLNAIWASMSGRFLFFHTLIATGGVAILYAFRREKGARNGTLLFFLSSIQLPSLLFLLFFGDAAPFRIYEQAMNAGVGLDAAFVRPDTLFIPLLLVGHTLLFLSVLVWLSLFATGGSGKGSDGVLRGIFLSAWVIVGFGILAFMHRNFETTPNGVFWRFEMFENFSFAAFLSGLVCFYLLSMKRREMNILFGIALTIAFHSSLLAAFSGVFSGVNGDRPVEGLSVFVVFVFLSVVIWFRWLIRNRRFFGGIKELFEQPVLAAIPLILFVPALLFFLSTLWDFGCPPFLNTECRIISGSEPFFFFLVFVSGSAVFFLEGFNRILVIERSRRFVFVAGLFVIAAIGGAFVPRFFFADRIASVSYVSQVLFSVAIAVFVFVLAVFVRSIVAQVNRRLEADPEESPLYSVFVLFFADRIATLRGVLLLSGVFLFVGVTGNLFKHSAEGTFHYYLLEEADYSDTIHYFSGDKMYEGSYEIQATDLYVRPYFYDNADPKNLLHLMIQHVGYLSLNSLASAPPINTAPQPPGMIYDSDRTFFRDLFEKFFASSTGGVDAANMTYRSVIDPAAGEIVREGPSGSARRTFSFHPSFFSSWEQDVRVFLDSVRTVNEQELELNHRYEYFYYFTNHSKENYFRLLPHSLVATYYVGIYPGVRFVRIGALLFGMALLLIFPWRRGEKREE